MQANVLKYYLYNFFLNFQLWWPIWIIYLKEDRGLSQAQVTLIDIPFWLSIVLLQIPAAALADRWGVERDGLGACAKLRIAASHVAL